MACLDNIPIFSYDYCIAYGTLVQCGAIADIDCGLFRLNLLPKTVHTTGTLVPMTAFVPRIVQWINLSWIHLLIQQIFNTTPRLHRNKERQYCACDTHKEPCHIHQQFNCAPVTPYVFFTLLVDVERLLHDFILIYSVTSRLVTQDLLHKTYIQRPQQFTPRNQRMKHFFFSRYTYSYCMFS